MRKQSYHQNVMSAFLSEFKKHIVKKPGRWGLLAHRLKRTNAKAARVNKLDKYINWSR